MCQTTVLLYRLSRLRNILGRLRCRKCGKERDSMLTDSGFKHEIFRKSNL